jgi:hypothetical protein
MLTTVIPVFNGERFLPATLDCIARQSRPTDRLVILDNCSTDSTPQIVERFRQAHPKLNCEWRQNERNLGVLGNLNRGLGLAAETKFLHLIMADDLVKPTFYEKLIPALESAHGPALGYTHNETIDVHGGVVGPADTRPGDPVRRVPKKQFLARQATLNTVLLPGVVFKTDFRAPLCLFGEMPLLSDVVFLAEWGARCEQIVELPEYLCQYRIHPFSATGVTMQSLPIWVLDEWRAMQFMLGLIDEPALQRWLRRQVLLLRFAARSQVKVDMMRECRPDFAREISRTVRQTLGPFPAMLGKFAVRARDLVWRLQGRQTKARQLVKLGGLG